MKHALFGEDWIGILLRFVLRETAVGRGSLVGDRGVARGGIFG
jgi:hypothetical protein